MVDQLDSLIVLGRTGTMAAAATALRLTPSAVSKRIALLEEQVGYRLIEPKGRKVQLTPAALRLVERIDPLLTELRSVLGDQKGAESSEITIGVTESVLASWGPRLLAQVAKRIPQLSLEVHAHRSPVVVERVRSGEYTVGICAGIETRVQGLRSQLLTKEPMVIVPSGLKKLSLKQVSHLEVLSIEAHALSWDLLRPQLRTLKDERGIQIRVQKEIESFSAVVQMAKADFGHGFAPLGITLALGVAKSQLVHLPSPSLFRGVSYVARATTLARPSLQLFFESLELESRGIKF